MSFKSRVRFLRIRRYVKGDSRCEAPVSPTWFLFRFNVRLDRLKRFAMGYNTV